MAGFLIPEQEGSLIGVGLPATDRFTVLLPAAVPEAIQPIEAATTELINVVQLPPAEADQPISVLPQPPGTGVTPLPPGAHSRAALQHTVPLRGATAPREVALPTRLPAAAHHPAPVHPVAAPHPAPDLPVAVLVVDAGKQV